jgi:hypothetical protein
MRIARIEDVAQPFPFGAGTPSRLSLSAMALNPTFELPAY